jgi:hypothetical protein
VNDLTPEPQLTFTDTDGWRFQAFAIDTPAGQFAHLEAQHRAHARVEDRIRCAKTHGLGRLPSRQFAINAVWVELALTAADVLAWTQTTLLADDLVSCRRPRWESGIAAFAEWGRHLDRVLPELAVRDLARQLADVEERLCNAVQAARFAGLSWARIGAAAGTAPGGAVQRWGTGGYRPAASSLEWSAGS